jgi:AraC-like DNA-binding protein
MREVLTLPRGLSGQAWLHEPHGRLHFWHHHDEPEFNLVIRGTARYLLNDRRYDLGPGCLVWLFPDQEHLLVDLSSDFSCWIGVIRPRLLRQACAGRHPELLVRNPPGHFCRRLSDPDSSFIQGISRDLDQARRVDMSRVNAGIGYLFLTAWQRYLASSDAIAGVRVHPGVERAAAALSRGEDDLALISAQAGLSYSQLSRLFHRQVGRTLVSYRARACLQRFLGLHRNGREHSLLSLALAAGFGSYAQFHRVFRREMGLTPQAWVASDPSHLPE